jgi:hypothetical protein
MFKNLSIAALLAVGVSAQYIVNKNIKYDVNQECTACIRGGFDYCIYGLAGINSNGSSGNCSATPVKPNFVLGKNGTANGYVCSSAFTDQLSYIVQGCRPELNQADLTNPCGDYEIDLSRERNDYRKIQGLARYQSCTYRIKSTCGYPAFNVFFNNPYNQGEFDITYAAKTGYIK